MKALHGSFEFGEAMVVVVLLVVVVPLGAGTGPLGAQSH
jgi:hypothetical protein